MFTVYDAYINALTEANKVNSSKFNQSKNLTMADLVISNIPDLYNCEWDLEFTDLVVCDHCNTVFDKDEIETQTREVEYSVDDWDYEREQHYDYVETGEEDYEACPVCDYGEDEDESFEYYTLSLEVLIDEIDNLKGIEDYAETGFVEALKDYIKKQDNTTEVKTESKKLEEDDEDYTKLKDTVKTEMLKYLKDNGIDVEHLRKAGVELDTMQTVIDKMLDTYVATSIADYENQFNKGLSWDYEISNNDIIITIEDM